MTDRQTVSTEDYQRLKAENELLQIKVNDYEFEKCVNQSLDMDGNHHYECKKGLWSVTSPDEIYGDQEAFHYFTQYRDDGEYHDIIGGITPLEALKAQIK